MPPPGGRILLICIFVVIATMTVFVLTCSVAVSLAVIALPLLHRPTGKLVTGQASLLL